MPLFVLVLLVLKGEQEQLTAESSGAGNEGDEGQRHVDVHMGWLGVGTVLSDAIVLTVDKESVEVAEDSEDVEILLPVVPMGVFVYTEHILVKESADDRRSTSAKSSRSSKEREMLQSTWSLFLVSQGQSGVATLLIGIELTGAGMAKPLRS